MERPGTSRGHRGKSEQLYIEHNNALQQQQQLQDKPIVRRHNKNSVFNHADPENDRPPTGKYTAKIQ